MAALAGARRHRLALFVAALVAALACGELFAGDAAGEVLACNLALALVGVAAAGLAREGALGRPKAAGRMWRLSAYLLVVGLVGGLAGATAHAGGAAAPGLALVAAAVLVCLLTGVFEEGVFRVAAVEAFEDAFGRADPRTPLRAATLSAVVFGLLHVSLADAATAQTAIEWGQLALKPVQAVLFGLCLAAVYRRTRSLWPAAVLHALFDLFYLAPMMAVAGRLEVSYLTGDLVDLAILALSTILLAPAAIVAVRSLRVGEK